MLSLNDLGTFNAKQLEVLKKRGIRNIRDLLLNFPRRYIDRSRILNLKEINLSEPVTFIGKIVNVETVFRGRQRLTAIVEYEGFKVELTFFQGVAYYKKLLKPGVVAAFSGTIDTFRGRFSIVHPEIEFLKGDELTHTGKIVPLYKTTEMMRNAYVVSRTLREAVAIALRKSENVLQDHLSSQFCKTNNLLPLIEAIRQMHFPQTMDSVEEAKRRIAFDELLVFAALMLAKKEKVKLLTKEVPKKDGSELNSEIVKSLPFTLTNDQRKAIEKLKSMTMQPHPFGALLQGDVGSGKTLVALLSALPYLESGKQIAVLAPTEILARQHYRNFVDYTANLPMFPIDILLGAEKASERKSKLDRISRGDSRLIVGTHALLQDDVIFHDLSYVIIDEQHRFGVLQRESLRSKGKNTDLLAMTATPIPRSLSLTIYGDLEQIIIKEKPANRKPIDTRLFPESELLKLYKGIKKYVDKGQQAYIVYPLIDESERSDWASLMADYETLEKEVFPDYRLGLLHGRLHADEKDNAMQKFKSGTIQILVTTTVIEVGVDIPNASVMLIRNAEKFGLSQLHQLRGRVGRGVHQSFCILVHSGNLTVDGEKRLAAMVESDDGFYLAQKDFEIRGAGELLGTGQAGDSEFRVADLRLNADLAELSRDLLHSDDQLRHLILDPKKMDEYLKKGLILFAN